MRSLAIILALSLSTAAQAEQIDLSTSTCEKFLKSNDEDMKSTLAWLDGYYKGEDDPPVIDSEKLVANAKKLGDFCAKNPSLGLITATDKLFGQ